jgi:hypothetical protein
LSIALSKFSGTLFGLFLIVLAIGLLYGPEDDRNASPRSAPVSDQPSGLKLVGRWQHSNQGSDQVIVVELFKDGDGEFLIKDNLGWYPKGESLIEVEVESGRRFELSEPTKHDQTALLPEKREFIQAHLDEFLQFRDSPSFKEFGFGVGGPHHQWLKSIDARLAPDDWGVLFTLRSLGMASLHHPLAASDRADGLLRDVRQALWTGVVHEWYLISPSGSLEWWIRGSIQKVYRRAL